MLHHSPFPGTRLAGVDASAVVMSYILWRFAAQPPEVKERIQAELDVAMPDAMIIPDLKILQNLPILDALIKEGELSRSAAYWVHCSEADFGSYCRTSSSRTDTDFPGTSFAARRAPGHPGVQTPPWHRPRHAIMVPASRRGCIPAT